MRQDVLPDEVRRIIDDVDKPPEPVIEPPPDAGFTLAGGYLDLDGQWHRTFQVRELTGRDEEALGSTSKVGLLLAEIISRGLVSVGPHKGGPDVVNGLLAGDWETVLLAIRSVTFGSTVDYKMKCVSCASEYEVTVDILKDISVRELSGPDDMHFVYTGRHGNRYDVDLPLGSTQRKLLQNLDLPTTRQTSILLGDCVQRIDNIPALPETVANMPLADRREILTEIAKRKPGPRPQEVTTLCPHCGAETGLAISIATLFQ